MRNKAGVNIFSILIFFCFMAMTACGGTRIFSRSLGTYPASSFSYSGQDYLELKDGKRIYGKKFSWGTGLIDKHEIRVDNQNYKMSETRSIAMHGNYYHYYKHDYPMRFIRGKLNVYFATETVSIPKLGGGAGVSSETRYYYYVQKGDDSELEWISNTKDIVKYVKDCPKAFGMLKTGGLGKKIRKDNLYLNRMFKIYNNDCKE
jgi:hypothetical protein